MNKLGSGRRIVLRTADSVSRFSSQTITQTPTVEGNDSPSADPLERHGLILPADYASSDVSSASIEMAMYAIEFAARRRMEPPREDLTTVILGSDFGGQPMDDIAVRLAVPSARR